MKQIDIKDLELELKVLQKKDTEDALAQGFTNIFIYRICFTRNNLFNYLKIKTYQKEKI